MIHTLYQKYQFTFATKVNKLIYTVKRWKWIGPHIPEEWYSRRDVKKILGILNLLQRILMDLVGKLGYFILFLVLPVWFGGKAIGMTAGDQVQMFCTVFFFMNCLMGSRVNSKLLGNIDESDYHLMNLMRLDAREHFLTRMIPEQGKQIVYYGIFLAITILGVFHGSVTVWLCLWVLFAAWRWIGERILLGLNDRYGAPLSEKNKAVQGMVYAVNILLSILAYTLYPLKYMLYSLYPGQPVLKFLSSGSLWMGIGLAMAVVSVVASVLCFRTVWNYTEYTTIARAICSMQSITSKKVALQEAKTANLEVKEEDLSDEELHAHMFEKKTGYEYLNALFFYRHKRLVRNMIRMKVIVAAAVFALLLVGQLVFHLMSTTEQVVKMQKEIWAEVDYMVAILVFFMYCASSGRNLTKAMFYNCDISLLKYGYFRAKEAILQNFTIRLRYMLKAELPMIGVLWVGTLSNLLLLGAKGHEMQIVLTLLCQAMLSIFYTALFLCMYYIFQPYTEGGSETGVGYKICSGMIYLVSYLCLQISTPPVFFVPAIIAVTVIVLIGSFFVAYLVAPKTFLLK